MRAWLSVCICVCLVSVVGCGGDNRGSLIKNTVDKMSEAATALSNIKDKVADFNTCNSRNIFRTPTKFSRPRLAWRKDGEEDEGECGDRSRTFGNHGKLKHYSVA